MLKTSLLERNRRMLSAFRRKLAITMAIIVLSGATGCDRLRSLVSRQALPDGVVFSPGGSVADGSGILLSNTGIPLAPDKCMHDEHGNRIKAIVAAANATVYTADGAVVRTPRLLDRFYVFGIHDNEISVGTDPRGTAEGKIKSVNCFVTSQMQVTALREETRPLRNPVSGFSSLDDIRSLSSGKAVSAACTETELSSGNNALRWMPVLDSHVVNTQHGEIQVLEIGAWTVQRGTHTSERTSQSAESLKKTLQQVDVVVVLDCTGSMSPHWKEMEKKLDEILRDILNSELDARVAVVAYRDKDPKDETAWVTKSTIFFDSVDPLKTWLSEQEPAGGGDWEEEVFLGLEKALQLLSKTGRKGAMQNLILIGDNGGHIKGDDKVLGDNGLAVVKSAVAQGATIDCIRIPYKASFNGDKELFPRQIEKLSAMTHGTVINLEDRQAENLVTRLKQKLEESKVEVRLQVQIATGLAEGKTKAELADLTNVPPSAMEWRIDRIQQRLGSDPTKLSTAVGDVGVKKIFVVTNPQAMEFGILMRKEEHAALVAVMDQLATSGIERPESLMELWNKSLAANTGDYDRPLHEILQLNGIPVRSGILSMTLAELLAMPHHGRVALREQVEVKFKQLAAATINLDEYGNLIVPVNAMP